MRNCNDTVVRSESEYESIREIRDKLANTILTCIAVLGVPIVLISFLRYLKVGGLSILMVHFTLYFLCLSAAICQKKITVKAKSLFVIGCAFVMAGATIMKWGITGSGIAYYIFCSILVTIFYGATPGIVVTLLDLAIMIIAAILFNAGFLQYDFNIDNFFSTPSTWIYASSVYGCFTIVLGVCLGRLYNSMTASIEKLSNRTSELKLAKEQMEMEITIRKQAETSLRESEERFRTVLENLPCGVSVHDLEGRHLIVNEETCRVKGYTREELLNLTIMETAGPALGPYNDVIELWQNIELGASITFETLTQRKDRSLYDSEVHLTKIMLEGQPVLLSLVFDITERKKIEERLARRSDLERLISEISSRIVGMSHHEVDAYIDEALAAIGKKTGVDHAYLFLSQSDRDLFYSINEWRSDNTVPQIEALQGVQPEKDFPWVTEMIRAQESVHVPDVTKLPYEARKEREYFQNRGIKSFVVIAMRQGENLIGFLGFDNIYETKTWSEDEIIIFRIIGEAFTSAIQRKKAERDQERLQAQLSTAIELAQLGPWELDIENQQYTFNDQFYKIYRTTVEEMGGYTISADEYKRRFVHPDDIHFLDRFKRKGMKPDAPLENRGEHRMLYADGEVGYVMAQSMRIKNSKGIPIKAYGVNQDITEWKLAQKKFRESEEKLARSKKMESLGLLAGGVAHDLNNVLSGIVSYPELLLLDLPADSKLRKPIETIQESGNKAVAIVQDLLTIARGAATTKEPLNLNRIIDEYLNSPELINLKIYHPEVKFKTALESDLFKISGSLIHIKKVVMNLVSNASEAIEKSGTVTISTSNRYIDMPISKYEDVKTGEYVVLAISDDGPGISPENLDRIFEPFFTKKVMGISGTGLGLTVVWNTVQDHSGYIDVKSDKNGTKFELYFPITREETMSKTSSVSMDELKGSGELILVVDDVDSQREISCRMLDSLGYRYVAVSGGEEAIEYLKSHEVELVLLDMIMAPGISGRETYEIIAKIRPGQKALIISGYSETEDVVAIQKLGAGGYVRKPFSLESLGRGIKEELIK